jgi:hypothetical protein
VRAWLNGLRASQCLERALGVVFVVEGIFDSLAQAFCFEILARVIMLDSKKGREITNAHTRSIGLFRVGTDRVGLPGSMRCRIVRLHGGC